MNFFTRQEWKCALLLLIVMAVGCFAAPKLDKRLNGTWTGVMDGDSVELRFKNGNFVSFVGGVFEGKGTYTTDNGTFDMDETHVFGSVYNHIFANQGLRNVIFESRWYLINEFIIEMKSMLLKSGYSVEQVEAFISAILVQPPAPYSVDKKNLTIAFKIKIGDETIDRVLVLTRKSKRAVLLKIR
jgi:hypothetical protein